MLGHNLFLRAINSFLTSIRSFSLNAISSSLGSTVSRMSVMFDPVYTINLHLIFHHFVVILCVLHFPSDYCFWRL
ncbi:hypothetical protein I7I53_00358 [Histoplasma capsulatum var. duboisii H88]|uniref:Uncharacterized protein n=1 Tax=Ajellomyces capsulatus (strain H88) TaxID=544711 RepID=A0A8A1LMF3_AJEC8|nr:hypothetical protein I7I53_00358 [Histoplasma capsulatum var. duboisii H88]